MSVKAGQAQEQLRDRCNAPLVKPDREAEMTAAYNDFTARFG